ncbi:MAG: SDR family NAD(P)-dependent oxidoreductase [Burkholderiales bacterium]
MPSNQMPLGALPARFRRPRVLIVGCGDVGLRAASGLLSSARGSALTSTPARVPVLQRRGIVPLLGNLDEAASLRRLAGVATHVVHMAPPPLQGNTDPRTRALIQALVLRSPPTAWVYGSTSGVYGDCGGAWIDETRRLNPVTERAQRRVDAERWLQAFGKRAGTRVSVLRIPGIYALDREGGTPKERLQRGTPVLQAADDVYTNHVHADDLARATVLSVWRGRALRVVHVSDDSDMLMGDYMDWAADLWQLPRPPRVSRAQAQTALPAMTLSFMGESRRMDNQRLKTELRLKLRYPTVREGLQNAPVF